MPEDHPHSGVNHPPRETHDVDLGDGHYIDWSSYQGSICGGIITHRTDKTESGWCAGSFWIDDRYNKACGTKHAIWGFNGNLQTPELTPSFLCHCGDHGFVRNGKWVRA